jgi:hypothetical protein
MQPRSVSFQAETDSPAVSSADLKQLKLKQYLSSQTEPRKSADISNAPSASIELSSQFQSLKPVLKSVMYSLITENSSVAAWSKAARQFDADFGRASSSISLDKFNEESGSVLDLGSRLTVSSNNERRLQNQLAASIAEIAELRSNSRQSSDLSLARENQELRTQLAAAHRARSQSASQLELQMQSKCDSLQSENEMLESKCRRLQLEIQRLNETSLPANFWEGQHSVLSEIYDLKKEYEVLYSAHMSVRAEQKLLVEEKNTLLAQLSNKEYECGVMTGDLKSCKLKISRLEFELKSRTSESLNGSDSVAYSSTPAFAGNPQLEAFVPTSRSASDFQTHAALASVSPFVSTSRLSLPPRALSASPADLRPTGHLTTEAASSGLLSQHAASARPSHSPSQVGEVPQELSLSDQGSQPYSQKMKAVLDLVSTLDSRLLSLDTMCGNVLIVWSMQMTCSLHIIQM